MIEKSKILIVDDSRIFRAILEKIFSNHEDIEVVGSVFNGEKALEAIKKNRPDIITLDIEMPGMSGIEILKQIQIINSQSLSSNPISVIMISALTRRGAKSTLEALELGAFDFITKPDSTSGQENFELLQNQILTKIRCCKSKRMLKVDSPMEHYINKSSQALRVQKQVDAICIGVSTGGPKALNQLLPELTSVTHVPIFIVQHMPPHFTETLADGLAKRCQYNVVEAKQDQLIANKTVYIAPGGKHLLIRRKNPNEIVTTINDQPPENGCRPSVDVLFRSVASVYMGNVIAIILTGMGDDGSKSLRALKRAGAFIIAQDEKSSVVWGMPGSAVATGFVDEIVSLNKIPQIVKNYFSNSN